MTKPKEKSQRVTLCVAEPYYMIGKCRLEDFENTMEMEKYRGKLDRGVTSWLLGEPEPKRRSRD